jgi:hypothetical protein
MAIVQWKKMNWFRTPSPWQQAEARRAKRKAAVEQFQSQNESFLSGVAGAQSNQVSGSATIATQLAIARIQAQAKAKSEALAKSVNQFA